MASVRLTGGHIGPYKIQSRHGAGGVAEVYQGIHVEDGSEVAIKVLRGELVENKDRCVDFEKEAEILKSLNHALIPKVKRVGKIGERPATILEFFPGKTLKQLVEEKASFDRLGCGLALVNVVAHLHSQSLIHNDLKLENVILRPDGRIGLVDFGNVRKSPVKKMGLLGKIFGRGNNQVFGTASYLAPELLQGGVPSFKTDVYALGVCWHLLLSGSAHFNDTRRTKRLNRMVKENAPSIGQKVEAIPQALAHVIDRCVSREIDFRPDSAEDMKKLFRRAIGEPLVDRVREISAAVAASVS